MPIISIIIAVYNNEMYLGSAVQSVLNQCCKDIEIIIIDDGSTDDTGRIADEIALENDNLFVYHQRNQWIYASFNNGIEKAKGEYIYILNSDDRLAGGSLAKLLDAIETYNHPDVVWTKVKVINCDDKQKPLDSLDVNATITKDEYYDLDLDKSGWEKILTTRVMGNQANLYKRSIMLKHQFRNDVYGADYLFNLDAAKDIHTCVFLSCDIYYFFEYHNKNMNVSVGKYYGYEHQMFNEFYLGVKQLLKEKDIYSEELIDFFRSDRRKQVIIEINLLLVSDSKRTYAEKLAILENETWDEVLEECYTKSGREGYNVVLRRELEKYNNNNL